ncbi:MAG: hypothetical protein QOJ59_876 [Thermomicrobiales bacterium]|nr:hypothetical protein [Thermomicrobiales bacterium]
MSRSLSMPKVGQRDKSLLWKLLPFLAAAVAVALIWAERRASKRGGSTMGTAPAGAPPMRERDPAAASVGTEPRFERPAPYATPGTTSGAMAGAEPAAAGPDVANQPAPIAEADAPGTASPEQLATTGPDMAGWVSGLVSDTGAAPEAEETAIASPGTVEAPGGEATTDAGVGRTGADETSNGLIPTPAAETTAIPENEGKGWIHVDGVNDCPADFPIKGNASSRIYHLPGEPTYEATHPEICFATEEAAVELGYRARKR